jgi:hypothetical protein
MINCVYYTPEVRCYRDGRVEKYYKTKKEWKLCNFKPHQGYFIIGIYKKNIKIHRLIAFCFLGLKNIVGNRKIDMIDHINHITTDNNIDNLRIVTQQKNQWNRTAKGYYWHNKKWQSRITLNGKTIHLGLYDIEEEAQNAYLKAKEKYHII